MSEPYNLFSGQSLERLTALSDGLFAVAMTLLVLDMRVPVSTVASVIALALVQLYFIVSPRLAGRTRR